MNKFKYAMIKWGAPVLALALPVLASAQIQNPNGTGNYNSPYNNINQITGASGIFCVIINWLFWGLIVLTIIFVLIAAFKYLTAAGNEEKVKSAANTLLYAAIAVIVGLIAKGFPYIISSFFGGSVGQVC